MCSLSEHQTLPLPNSSRSRSCTDFYFSSRLSACKKHTKMHLEVRPTDGALHLWDASSNYTSSKYEVALLVQLHRRKAFPANCMQLYSDFVITINWCDDPKMENCCNERSSRAPQCSPAGTDQSKSTDTPCLSSDSRSLPLFDRIRANDVQGLHVKTVYAVY